MAKHCCVLWLSYILFYTVSIMILYFADVNTFCELLMYSNINIYYESKIRGNGHCHRRYEAVAK